MTSMHIIMAGMTGYLALYWYTVYRRYMKAQNSTVIHHSTPPSWTY